MSEEKRKKYLVDPELLLDILSGRGDAGPRATAFLERHRGDELVLAPTSYVALSAAFMGIRSMQDQFLKNFGITVTRNAPAKVMDAAYTAWSAYQKENPTVKGGMSVFDSLYIGAYALLFDGILTRQGDLYRRYFDTLNVLEP